jgi:hypothetical protein
VQERHPADGGRVRLQELVEVLQVLHVAACLLLRVQQLLVAPAVDRDQPVGNVGEVCPAPLLVLHHQARRPPAGMDAKNNQVHPLGGQREPVLDQYVDVVQPCGPEFADKRGNAALPAAHL